MYHHRTFGKPHGHLAIACFGGDLFCLLLKSVSCPLEARLSGLLGVSGVCGWETAVNCIDKQPRVARWAAGVQYEG